MKPWKLITQKTAYRNKYVRIDQRTYRLPNGKTADYFIRDGNVDVASIFALTTDHKIILAQEFRPGPGKILDELPGGIIDKKETPLQAARRELMEETGYKGKMVLLTSTFLSAYSNHKKYCFLALNCKKTDQIAKNDENEFIEVILKSQKQFIKQVQKGDLTDLETALLGLDYLKTHGGQGGT